MKIVSARQAVSAIKSGDTVSLCGVVSLVTADRVMAALGERYRETHEPRDLTVFTPNRMGWSRPEPFGMDHISQKGMVKRLYTATFNAKDAPEWSRLSEEGEIEAYSLPMGVMFRWIRECAARSPGLLTDVGLNTYTDPGSGDNRVNRAIPMPDFVERMEIDGKPCLRYKPLSIDVAIIRGTVTDEDGNLSLHGEPVSAGMKQFAMAARNNRGIVIAQVKHVVKRGSIHPRMVEVPGFMVDYVVVEPESIQSQDGYEPGFTGEVRYAEPPWEPLPQGQLRVMTRRAALELRPGDVVNLGVGVGTNLPALTIEEGIADQITFSIEHGAVGGIPAKGTPGSTGAFGAHYNPTAIIDSAEVFDIYHGGGLDVAVLGFAEIDASGSVNVSRFGGRVRGAGGFMDIVHRTPRILICGTLTASGLAVEVDPHGPGLKIASEGRFKKLVEALEEVTLHAPTAIARGQMIRIITERCVFDVDEHGLCLIEVAPGIDIERDIVDQVGFAFRRAETIRPMAAELFRNGPMALHRRPEWAGAGDAEGRP